MVIICEIIYFYWILCIIFLYVFRFDSMFGLLRFNSCGGKWFGNDIV